MPVALIATKSRIRHLSDRHLFSALATSTGSTQIQAPSLPMIESDSGQPDPSSVPYAQSPPEMANIPHRHSPHLRAQAKQAFGTDPNPSSPTPTSWPRLTRQVTSPPYPNQAAEHPTPTTRDQDQPSCTSPRCPQDQTEFAATASPHAEHAPPSPTAAECPEKRPQAWQLRRM